MNVGICGPITVAPFRRYLDINPEARVPQGLGGTPVTMLVEELLARGNRIVIFTLDREVRDEVVLSGEQLKICIGPLRASRRARDFFRVEREYLKQAIGREQTDLIHAHWTYEYALAALDSGRPTLVTAHDAPLQILRHVRDAYRALRLAMAWKVARRAPRMTAVSEHIAEHFRRYMRYRGQIDVVPNAIPDCLFELRSERRRGATAGEITVATVLNGWSPLKNAKVALEAMAMVRRQLPAARLLMFGEDYGHGQAAEQWARAHGLAEGVEFAGALPREFMFERLAGEADILLHPSREESFGMAVAEGMALGLAVVGGRRSGAVPFLLESGRAGELVDVTSAESVAATVVKLAKDEQMRGRYGKAARESASRRFRGRTVVEQYESIYRQIC